MKWLCRLNEMSYFFCRLLLIFSYFFFFSKITILFLAITLFLIQLILLTQLARRSINVEVVRTLPSEIWLGVFCPCCCLRYSHAVMLSISLAGARGSAPSLGFGFCWSSQHRQQQQGFPGAGALAHAPDEEMSSADAPREYQPAWGTEVVSDQLARGPAAPWLNFATLWGVGPSTSTGWH